MSDYSVKTILIVISIGLVIGVFSGYFGGFILKNNDAIRTPSIFFNMTASVGTILSVSVALSFGVYPILTKYLNRPRLCLSILELGRSDDGYLRNYFDYEWAILLENNGKKSAKNVMLKIKSVTALDEERRIQYNNNPIKLIDRICWNDYVSSIIVSLGPFSDYAHLSNVNYGDVGFKDCIIDLIVGGDNFEAFSQKLKFTYSDNYNLTKLEFVG